MTQGNGTPKGYEELLREAQAEFAANMAQMEAKITALHAKFAAMPDVQQAPATGALRDFRGEKVMCPCGGTLFAVLRWVTINGVRHRMETSCVSCQSVRTWDWTDRVWVPEG